MSVSICTTCLSRLRISSLQQSQLLPQKAFSINLISSFHSSAIQQDNPVKKRANAKPEQKYRESKSSKVKKNKRVRKQPRQVGELRTLRKRIVLSNTNALEIQGMQDLSPQNMAQETNVGKMMGLEGKLLDKLRDAKAFKISQNWHMFRRPATLVRENTVELGKQFEEVNESVTNEAGQKKVLRQILAGEKMVGKSILLLQALAMAYMNRWVVINIPEAQELTYNRSSYIPAPRGENAAEQLYHQPHLTAELLSRMAYSNDKLLGTMSPIHEPPASISLKQNGTLHDLALLGAENHNIAWSVWQYLWAELTQPSKTTPSNPRPPVLVAIDSIDHWMGLTQYKSNDGSLIHAHQFTLIKQFLSILFPRSKRDGTQQQPPLANNGGMIIAATTGSNTPTHPSFNILLQQLIARASGTLPSDPAFPLPEPYSNADSNVLNLFSDTPSNTADAQLAPVVKKLQGLTKHESKGLLEYFARSGLIKEAISDKLVNNNWTLSAGGNVGQLVKLGKRSGKVFEDGVASTSSGMWPGQGLHRAVK